MAGLLFRQYKLESYNSLTGIIKVVYDFTISRPYFECVGLKSGYKVSQSVLDMLQILKPYISIRLFRIYS